MRANRNSKEYRKLYRFDAEVMNVFEMSCFFRQIMRELLPSDLIKLQSPNDWKRAIVTVYNHDAGMTSDDAKITFLKIVYR